MIWQEDDEIKCFKYGGIICFPLEKVDCIKKVKNGKVFYITPCVQVKRKTKASETDIK
jgi:hypothetical protein